jgi:Na+/melibiose symporter-like transporter
MFVAVLLQPGDTEVYTTPALKHRMYTHTGTASGGGSSAAGGTSDAHVSDEVWAAQGNTAEPPLSRVTVVCYSVGHFLNDATASCWFSYLLYYLESAQMLNGVESGIVLFSGQLCDAIATPLVGYFSDHSKGLPALGMGRRKAWNFVGVIVVIICFFFVFGVCLPCEVGNPVSTWKTVNFAVFASLFNVGWASVQVSHMCMVPELTNDEGERVMLNSARYALTILANVMVFIVMTVVLWFYNGGSSDNYKDPNVYLILTLCVLVVGGALSFIFLVGTKEKIATAADAPLAYTHVPVEQPQDDSYGGREGSDAGSAFADVMPAEDLSAPLATSKPGSGATPKSVTFAIAGDGPLEVEKLPNGHHHVGGRPSSASSSASAGNINVESSLNSGVPVADGKPGITETVSPSSAGNASKPSPSLNAKRRSNPPPLLPQPSLGSLNPSKPRPLRMTWRDWLSMWDFYKVAAVYMFVRLSVNVSQVYLLFFVNKTLQMTQVAIAVVPLLAYLASLAATIVMKRLSLRLGRRNGLTFGAILFAAACCLMMFLESSFSFLMYPAVVILGLGSAVTMVISVSMEADLVGRNVETAAFVYGAMSLTDKLSNGVAILAIQTIGDTLDMDSKSQFYRWVNACVPLVSVGLATLVAWTIKFPKHLQSRARSSRANANTDADGDAASALDDASVSSSVAQQKKKASVVRDMLAWSPWQSTRRGKLSPQGSGDGDEDTSGASLLASDYHAAQSTSNHNHNHNQDGAGAATRSGKAGGHVRLLPGDIQRRNRLANDGDRPRALTDPTQTATV